MAQTRSAHFALSTDDAAVLEAADRFARKELAPLSRRMDDEEWWPPEAFPKIGDGRLLASPFPTSMAAPASICSPRAWCCRPSRAGTTAMALSWVAHDNLCANNIYPQRQRGAAPQVPAGPLHGTQDRRARPDRARRRLRRARLDAHDRAPRRRPLRAQRHARSTSPTARSPTCCWSTPRPTRARRARASRPSSSRRTCPASRSRRSSTRWAIAAARPASWCSRIAACRPRTWSATRTAA